MHISLLLMPRRMSKFCFTSRVSTTKKVKWFLPPCALLLDFTTVLMPVKVDSTTGRSEIVKASWIPFTKPLGHFQKNYFGSYIVSDAFPACEAIQIPIFFKLVFCKWKIQNFVVKLEGCYISHRQAESVHSVNTLLVHKWQSISNLQVETSTIIRKKFVCEQVQHESRQGVEAAKGQQKSLSILSSSISQQC